MNKKKIKAIVNIFLGLTIISLSLFLFISIITYNDTDPSFNTTKNSKIVLNSMGIIGSYTSDIFIQFFGISSFLLVFLIAKIGFNTLTSKLKRYNKTLKISMFMNFIISSCAILSIMFGDKNHWGYNTSGGNVGIYLKNLTKNIPENITLIVSFILFFISIIILLDYSYRKLKINFVKLHRKLKKLIVIIFKITFISIKKIIPKKFLDKFKNKKQEKDYIELIERQNQEIEDLKKHIKSINGINNDVYNIEERDNKQNFKLFSSKKDSTQKDITQKENKNYKIPTLNLLASSENKTVILTKEELKEQANDLIKVLKDFKINGKIISVKAGPVITLHEFEPSAGTKSSRIINLADDIARNLKVKSARISVIPERNVVGIELPNKKRNKIFLKDILDSSEYKNINHSLPIVLGSNIAGESVLMDLAKAPHLLIAGTTGSGKSVCINTMILSLLYKFTPEECKMIMIDPKMLELSVYEGIPHLLMPVVIDSKKAITALKWVVSEMENRYKTMSNLGVRNIYGYNDKVKEAIKNGEILRTKNLLGYDEYGDPIYENKELETKKLPFIVVIVDEMADLMITAGKDIESLIQRIAQMARAAGIHIIMATQRPSVDIITGVIKANFPSRISFLVSSKIDSKVIMGEQGAEQLLGMGDMLYMPNGGKINRAHGPFVSDTEVESIVNYIKSQNIKPNYVNLNNEEDTDSDCGNFEIMTNGGNDDDLYNQAIEIIKRDKKVSISYIQRQLRIGYNKAANLVERMEKEGIVSPPSINGKREIL